MRTVLILAAMLLAGCSDSAAPDEPSLVTDTTGLIRGLVFDQAIMPVERASVNVVGVGTYNSNADGEFLVTGLPAGTYQLVTAKAGFFQAYTSAQVVAGEPNPSPVKIQLDANPHGVAYATGEQFDGFMEQGFTAAGARASSADSPEIFFERIPEYFQVEMTWGSTQQLGEGMEMTFIAYQPNATTGESFAVIAGSSPIHIGFTKDQLVDAGIGPGVPLTIAIFSAPADGAVAPASATIDQPYTIYMHRFFGFLPDEGWTFLADGEPVPP